MEVNNYFNNLTTKNIPRNYFVEYSFINIFGEKYKLYFPESLLDNKLLLIHGYNGFGKTLLLNKLKEKFSETNDVIYYDSNRKFYLSKEEMDSIDVIVKMETNKTYMEYIKFAFDMDDCYSLYSIKKNDPINNGFLQIINFFYSLYDRIQGKENCILIVDDITQGLHPILAISFIKSISHVFKKNISKIIFTSYSDYVIKEFENIHSGEFNHYNVKCIDIVGLMRKEAQ